MFENQVSRLAMQRPGLDQLFARLQARNILVVCRLGRISRSLPHLIETICCGRNKGAGLRPLTESINTFTAVRRLYPYTMGALAEFKRAPTNKRTRAGVRTSKPRGVDVGHKPALTPAHISHARQLVEPGESPPGVARSKGGGRSTLHPTLKSPTTQAG